MPGKMQLPREPWSGSWVTNAMIAQNLAALRIEQLSSIRWDIRPSVGMVARDVQRLGLDIRSFREPLTQAVREVIIPSIKQNFRSEGRPPWAPLTEMTAKIRGGRGGAPEYHPILHRTGKLEKRVTQLSAWDIGQVTATIRRLPADVYYGTFHQAGVSPKQSGWQELAKHAPGSLQAESIIAKFIPKAAAELGGGATASHIRNRAIGLLIDSDRTYSLPQRMFVMYQEQDIVAIRLIFEKWFIERAMLVGRFRPG